RQQIDKENDFSAADKIRGFEDAIESVRTKTGPVITILDLSRDIGRMLALAQEIKIKFPHVHLIATSGTSDTDIILQAMRSGAEEFLAQPFNWPTVVQSLERIRAKINLQSAKSTDRGRIVTVFSNKGGVGTTTVATNLAVALATEHRKSVCLVDLVLQFGSVTSFLNLEPSYTILDLVKNLKHLDPMLVEGSLVRHASGVRVLAEPFHAEDASAIKHTEIEEILDALIQSFDFVIVDAPKEFDDNVAAVVERSHQVLFVTEMDIPSLKNSRRAIDLFQRVGVHQANIRLILNRYIKTKVMDIESVEKALATKVFWTLPNDYPTAISAINQGISIVDGAPKSDLARGYRGLAERLVNIMGSSAQAKMQEEEKSSILRKWLPGLTRKAQTRKKREAS
ncbi:MAG TPA: P-loop NTPase, partial [Verrucomicrobiae bacterium]|nr:P-loop NTPase [Verrucomicrobiae bacterium]